MTANTVKHDAHDPAKHFIPKHPEKYKGTYPIVCRSSWERAFCMMVDTNVNIVQWASEPERIPYTDPITKKQKVYIFHGTNDGVILPESSVKLKDFYQSFGVSPKTHLTSAAAHGFPSTAGTWPCSQTGSPYMVNCWINGAEEIFRHFWGDKSKLFP